MNRIVAILALAFAISPMAAQKVRVDFDHSNDLSHYQTCRWAGPPTGDDLNQLMQGRVGGFIEEGAVRQAAQARPNRRRSCDQRQRVRLQGDVFTTLTNSTGFGWDAG